MPMHTAPCCCAGLPDIERLTRKLERRKATLADLCQLYRASSRIPLMVAVLQDNMGPHAELLMTRWDAAGTLAKHLEGVLCMCDTHVPC